MPDGARESPIPRGLLAFLRIRRFNSPGFFFVSFAIPIVAHETMHATGAEMGLLFSLQTAGNMLGAPFSGRLANRPELRGPLIMIGSFGRGVAYLVIYLAILLQLYWLMVLGTICLGIGAGFFWTPMEAVISDGIAYNNRAEAFGRASREDGIGGVIGSLFAFTWWTVALDRGFPLWFALVSFPIFAMSNMYAGMRVMATIGQVPRLVQQTVAPVVRTAFLRSRALSGRLREVFFVLLALLFIESAVGGLVGPFLQVYLLEHVTSEKSTLSMLYMPGAIIAMVLAAPMGRLVDRVRPELWLPVVCLVGTAATWALINTTSLVGIAVAFVLQNLAVSAGNLVVVKAVSEVSPQQRGSAMGIKSFVNQAGGIVGPLIGGVLWQSAGERSPFYLSLTIKAMLGVAYYFVFKNFVCALRASRKDPVQESKVAC